MAMPRWILAKCAQHWHRLLLASLWPLLTVGLLLVIQTFLQAIASGAEGELGSAERKEATRWLYVALAAFLPALHGMLWAVSQIFLDPAPRAARGGGWSFPLSFLSLRSLWVSLGWLTFAALLWVALTMIVGTLAFRDLGSLFGSTIDQANELAQGTRVAPERGSGGQQVDAADFRPGALEAVMLASGLVALWLLVKALVGVPLRLMGEQADIVSCFKATPGWRGVRLTLWVALAGGLLAGLFGFYQHLGGEEPGAASGLYTVGRLLLWQFGLLIFLSFVGGALAWHAQKSAD